MRNANYRPELGKEGVMAACLQLLDVHHIWNQRINSGDTIIQAENGKRYRKRGARKGTADILCTPRSLRVPNNAEFAEPGEMMRWIDGAPAVVWIECKASDGKQREGQKEFQAEVEAAGHTYLLIDDVQQLIDWLKQESVIR